MPPGIAIANRRTVLHLIDPQSAFRLYAVVSCVIGASVVGTGIRGIPGLPLAQASLIWIGGMSIVFAGCAASGLALVDDPTQGRRALHRFAAGHILLGLIVTMQWAVYWDEQGLPLWAALTPLVIGVGFVALAAWLGERTTMSSPNRHRSSYEEHIRQMARREERARLARDLHDAVKQQLFVIQTAAATAQARIEHDLEGTRTALDQARTAAREATTEMEALLEELQAAPLENTGLVEALKKQCEALALRTGAHVSFEPRALPPQGSLPPGAHEAIYRVAQEALANVARHARANQVTVSLTASARRLELRVADNGSGFDAAAVAKGMGMTNMNVRAAELNGRLTIVGSPSGTEVILVLPLVSGDLLAARRMLVAFLMLVLSFAVFYGIRGHAPEQPGPIIVGLFGVMALWRLVTAYRGRVREQSE